jgi:septal ring-binding cell division protein DamX
MSMAEMTQEELVQEVLDRVLQSSTGVEDLETVTSLSGVKSLPGEKDGKMVNVPLELIGKPASDAAARAEAAAKKAEGAVAGLEEKTQAATEAATKANEAAAKQKTPLQGGTDYGSSHRRGYRTLFLMDGNRQRFT